MHILMTSYVPYNPQIWASWWNSVMTTIGSSVSVGFIVFGILFCIGLFKIVFRYFL